MRKPSSTTACIVRHWPWRGQVSTAPVYEQLTFPFDVQSSPSIETFSHDGHMTPEFFRAYLEFWEDVYEPPDSRDSDRKRNKYTYGDDV